jgi:hypothetical protein
VEFAMLKKTTALLVAGLAVVTLSACEFNPFGGGSADDLQESWKKLDEINSAAFDAELTLAATSDGENVSGEITAAGVFDGDTDNPQFSVDTDITMDAGAQGGVSVSDLMLRTLGTKMYVMIGGLDLGDMEGAADIMAMVEPYLGQWFFLDGNDERLQQYIESAGAMTGVDVNVDTEQAELTPEQIAKLNDIVARNYPLRDVERTGSETVSGVASDIYGFGGIDYEKLWDLMVELNREFGDAEAEQLTDADKQEFLDAMQDLVVTGTVAVAQGDGLIRRMTVDMNYEKDAEKLDVGMTLTLDEVNQDVSVEEPQDAEDLMTYIENAINSMFGSFSESMLEGLDAMEGMDSTMDYSTLDSISEEELNQLMQQLESQGL